MITQVYRPGLIFVWMENIFDAGQPWNIEEVCPDEVSAWNIVCVCTERNSGYRITNLSNSDRQTDRQSSSIP